MGIGIGISVSGTDKLREARREIEFVNTGLRETETLGDVTIKTHGMEGMLAGIKGIVNETKLVNAGISDVVAELRKLQGVGNISIGLPGKSEMRGMADGVRDYSEEVGKAKKDLSDLAEAHRRVVSIRSRQPQVEKPDSHYDGLIKLPQAYASTASPAVEQAARAEKIYYDIPSHRAPTEKTKQQAHEAQQKHDRMFDKVSPATEAAASQGQPLDIVSTTMQMQDAMRKLKGIDTEGSRRGGIITPAQAKEAARLYDSIKAKLKEYEDEIQRTGTKIDSLYVRKKKLEQTGAFFRTGEQEKELESLRKQIDELTAAAEKYQQKHDRMFDKVGTTAERSQQNITGYRQQEEAGAQASIGSTIKKALGWTLAAAGGFSVLGFLGQSRGAYQQAVGHEGTLHARGIKDGYNDSVGLGIGPLEHMQHLETLSQTTGLTGPAAKRAARMSEMFSKSQGVGLEEVTGFRGAMYQATGKAGDTSNAMLATLSAQGIEKSRMPELLKVMERHLGVMASAYKGSGISDNQAVLAAAAAVKAMGSKDIETQRFAKSGEFANAMQNSMLDTGSTAGNILAFSAAGGYDGDMTWDKQYDIQAKREQGLWNLDMRKRFMAQAESMAGSGDDEKSHKGRAAALKALVPNMGLSIEGYGQMEKALSKGGILEGITGGKDAMLKRLEEIKGTGGINGKEAEKMLADIKANTANSKLSLEAQKEIVEIKAGEKIHEMFSKFERAALGFADALMDKNWKGAFDNFGKAVDALGPVGYVLAGAATLLTGSKMLGMINALSKVGRVAAVTEAAAVGGTAIAGTGIAATAAAAAPVVIAVLGLLGLAWMAKKYGDSAAIEKMEKQQKELADAGKPGAVFGNSATAGPRRPQQSPSGLDFAFEQRANTALNQLRNEKGYGYTVTSRTRPQGQGAKLFSERLLGKKGIGNVVDPWDSAHEKGMAEDFYLRMPNGKGGDRRATLDETIKALKSINVKMAKGKDGQWRGKGGGLSYLLENSGNDWYVHSQLEGISSQKPVDHKQREEKARKYLEGIRKEKPAMKEGDSNWQTALDTSRKILNGEYAEPPKVATAKQETKKDAAADLAAAKQITEGNGYFNVTSDRLLTTIRDTLIQIEQKLAPHSYPIAKAPAGSRG